MAKGEIYPPESLNFRDSETGVQIRQVTTDFSNHHHPFFIVPAYDDLMKRLFFISERSGKPQIFAEIRQSGELLQLTERDNLSPWSIYPSHDGESVFFTAGTSGWRIDLDTLEEVELVNMSVDHLREQGTVAAAMGTTALSGDDRWWAIRYNTNTEKSDSPQSAIAMVDTKTGQMETILQRDSISHMQFCPDDPNLLYYAGPLTDRIWVINRDGSNNRRLYARDGILNEWITHESWIPRTRELAFVDWPNGIRCINVDNGSERRVTTFNAWHAVCSPDGTLMVADTNYPDIGIQLFDPRDGVGKPTIICQSGATSVGDHWKGPFPYANGPINVYAPQHTHPHPSFSPDGKLIVFTSDRSGWSQIYEVTLPADILPIH